MNYSSTFKSIRNRSSFSVVACVTALSMCTLTVPQAHGFGGGGSGNPFGNGSFFSTEGTFQATIRGTDGVTGTAIFSTLTTGSGGGTFTIYSGNKTYTGNVNASTSGNTLAVSLEASLPGTGAGISTLVVATSNLTVIAKDIVYGGNTTQTVSTPDRVTTIGNRTITQNQTNFVGGLTTNTTTEGLTTNTTIGMLTTNTTIGGLTTNTTTEGLTTNRTQSGFTSRSFPLQSVSDNGTTYNSGQVIIEGDKVLFVNSNATITQNSTSSNTTISTSVTQTPSNSPASVSTSNQTNSVSTSNQTNSVTTTPSSTPASVSTSNQTTSNNSTNYDSGQVTTITGGNTTTVSSIPDRITEKWGIINTVANSTYNDVDYAAGSFTATLYNTFPNQAFNGSGTITFQYVDTSSGVPELKSTVSTITVSGTRTSNTAGVYTPYNIDRPKVYTTYSKEVLK